MLNRSGAVLALLCALLPAASAAQSGPDSDIVDRVVAVVGDSIILRSEIDFQVQQIGLTDPSQPKPNDPGYGQFRRDVLNGMVDRLLVLQAAARDTLVEADDATIDQQVTDYISQLTLQYGGQVALQQALRQQNGMTLAEFRDFQRKGMRQEQLVQAYLELRRRNARPVDVSEEELHARFEEVGSQLGQRPRLISFQQISIRPSASDSARAEARAEAEALLARLQAGEDFAELARQYSDDPGSAPQGGDLGWFRRGQLVREVEDAAFSLGEGRTSGIIESEYGFHIVRVERTRGRSEVQARHILKMPRFDEADIERARQLASRTAERVRAGESMASLRAELADHLDPASEDSLTVAFDQLPPQYAPLNSAATGDVVGPLRVQQSQDDTRDLRFAVVKVTEIREAGAYTFDDLRSRIAAQLEQEKQQQRIIEALRANTHIEIRM